MKKKKITVLLFTLAILFTFGCSKNIPPVINTPTAENNNQNDNNQSQIPDTPVKEPVDLIKEKIETMTLDEKIGQLVMSGLDEYTNNDHAKTLMNAYHVGGFILLGQNIKDTNQMLTLINALKETNAASSDIPLFLGIDEEGGRVTRLPSEFVKLPTNSAIGKVNNTDFSYQIGQILGKELTSFGLNIDFAPVLDINSNPKNPVIGNRSFGNNASLVSDLGIQTMKGIQSQNIISTVKHFPGHGDTSVDSHIGLPIVNNDLNRLKSLELVPFSKAIGEGADMVMVAHILLPKIDAESPSSFSKAIITDILRNSLNYNGVVITDDMTMGAILKNYNVGDAAVKSLNAGTDIILVCHDFDKETAVLKAIKDAVTNGTLSIQSIDDKVYRILKLKEKYHIKDTVVPSVNVEEINKKISKLLGTYIKG